MKKVIFLVIGIILSSNIFSQECMEIGVNFHDVQYWSNGENPFKDEMKQSGDFFAFYDFNWDDDAINEVPRDENGYPNAGIPYSVNLGSDIGVKDLYARKMISSQGRLPQVDLVFLYEGNGSISINGAIDITNESPGRIELTCRGNTNIYLTIDQSDPAPNHARNFRLVALEDEGDFETNIWKADFLEKLAPFASVRMMDWTQTNSCTVWDWDQRTSINYNCQNEKSGVAYEYIADLCNSQDKDLWICVPHMATPDYIAQMANFFKNNLNSDVKIYVEYSNETWNWLFDQTAWIIDDFTWIDSSFPHNDLYDPSESQPYNSGLLAKRAFKIWRETYGLDSLKIQRVLGCKAASPWIAEEKVRATDGYFDFLSPAWYFGTNNFYDFSADVDAEEVLDSCRVEFYVDFWETNFTHYDMAEELGKKVMCYEGGQHITANGDEDFHGLQAFFDAQVHPGMYDLYDDVIDTLRHFGATMLMAYTLGGKDSEYGSWGHITDFTVEATRENAPKYIALLDNLCIDVAVEDVPTTETSDFLVYPNPTNGLLTINLSQKEEGLISALDITGKPVLQQKIGNNRTELNLTNLKSGIYFIQVLTNTGAKTKKIVLQR